MDNNYSHWSAALLADLNSNLNNDKVGQTILLENEHVKVWYISLKPGERLSFHKHSHNYFYTALTDGSAISNYNTGISKEISYKKNDTVYHNVLENGSFIHDLKNTGNADLQFITVEFL